MENTSTKHKSFSDFLNKKGNENIKFEKIVRKNAPDGFCVDIDSFTEEQMMEFVEIANKFETE